MPAVSVSATFVGNNDYGTATATTTLTITKATPSIAFSPASAAFVYDGQPHALSATATGAGGAVLGPVPLSYGGTATPPVDAGTYAVSATFEGTANYTARTITTTLRIDPAAPVLAVTGGVFVYDGQPHPATASVAGAGNPPLGRFRYLRR